nr:MAG TPA_asm: hypothetical protein [Caudoviricetes sp.]DAL69472.1 MAG TPA: hypothetical protein [Caudoviricetes sp.]DAO07141.1 MAG TPA: hypothetical protein [Caudoviricetes sp.]DAV37206.1 MAG TPA: hypothetical protein [Caudoviricetes sp.]DAX99745.1 MAG TPA: hypothetical protein [Caudoviricetes sp.]
MMCIDFTVLLCYTIFSGEPQFTNYIQKAR